MNTLLSLALHPLLAGQDKKQKVRFLWQTFARLMCADDTNFF